MEIKNILIPYKPLPFQLRLHQDNHRFRTIVAGRRSGKTTFSVNELIRLALQRNLPIEYWYIAPFFYQAKVIAWRMLLNYIPKELLAKKPNETELSVELVNGSKIALKGADNPYGLEGIALGGVIIDEIAAISHFDSLWQSTIRPMLSDYQSPAIFISKPRGFNHFHRLAKQGDHNHIIEGEPLEEIALDPDFITYRFETEQNCQEHNSGYIKHQEIEAARRQLPEEAFNQEYLAKFIKYTGLVHKLFSRETHIIPYFEVPEDWRKIRGWDYGSRNPTASIRIAIDPDNNWFIETCYKKAELSVEQHAENIHRQDYGLSNITGYADPSGKQWTFEFNQKGFSIIPARKDSNTSGENWIQLGIDQINQKLRPKEGHTVILPSGRVIENAPSLFVLNTLENHLVIEEFETLAYKESVDGTNTTVLDDTRDPKGHFDLLAALRYAAVSSESSLGYFTVVDLNEFKTQPVEELSEEKLKQLGYRNMDEYNLDLEIHRQAVERARRGQGDW